MAKADDEYKPKESGVRKEKEGSVKQPLRTLPMRQAKINTVIVSEDKAIESGRILRSCKTPTTKSTTKEPSTKKATKATSPDKGIKKIVIVASSSNPPETTQTVIRRPSIRTARRNIKVKNIRARSSKCQLFFCDKCDKVYDHYSELVYHQRRHTGEKPFACTWPGCTAAFSASNARVRHLRIHTGEKPYVCPYSECGRRFTYWKDLKLHKFRHSGEKPHKCDWPACSSRFFRRDDLKHHRYTHTGEKPYKCTVPGCESAFTQKSPLNLHMRKIHKILPGNKAPDKAQVQATNFNNVIINGGNNNNEVNNNINNNVPTICEYPIYQPAPTIIRQPVINSMNSITSSNNISNNLEFSNANHSNANVQCINVTDKLSSILVTCDVSPATVHAVNHQFNHDVNGWSDYAYAPETVDLNQNIQATSNSIIGSAKSNLMKEPSVQVKPIENNINHMPDLNVLLVDACQSNQVNESNLPVNDNNLSSNKFDPINQVETIKLIDTQVSCASVNTVDNSASTQTNFGPEKESSVALETINTSTEKANVTDKSINDESEKTNVEDGSTDVNASTTTRPTRKRANYRIKASSTTTKTCEVAVIRPKPVIESKSKTKVTKQVGSKRTIAIQTSKRQSVDKTNRDKFKCNYCEREFKAKHDRDCHHMTHTGEKPRACDWPGCDYRCITKSKLTRHQRKHTGERNYPCDWPGCGKKFSTSRHMKEHRRIHTGEKPFKCDWPGCDKWFSRKDHIKNHRFTHTGEKPRKCPFLGCEAAFIQLSPLKKHMELHKRDGGAVPNRTRKRKTSLNQAVVNEDPKKPVNECNSATVQINAMTLEMVTSRPIVQNDQTAQGYNMNMLTGQENQNLCLPAYDDGHNNTQANIEYEVMFRHPSYC